jgi:hypothetical protein
VRNFRSGYKEIQIRVSKEFIFTAYPTNGTTIESDRKCVSKVALFLGHKETTNLPDDLTNKSTISFYYPLYATRKFPKLLLCDLLTIPQLCTFLNAKS